MIRLFSIEVTDKDKHVTLATNQFDGLHFVTEATLNKYISHKVKYWTEVLGEPVSISPHYSVRPPKDINPLDIAIEACKEMDVTIAQLLSSNRERELVDKRVKINQILVDADFTLTEIEQWLWGNRIYYHYKKNFKNMCETDKYFLDGYDKLKETIMTKLFKK
jgi:hypothetical protein